VFVDQPLHAAAAQLGQLLHDRALAVGPDAECDCMAVGLRVVGELVEAGIASTRAPRRLGVGIVEVAQHCVHRRAQAVQVEAEEADRGRAGAQVPVVVAQPVEPGDELAVAPHPAREALEVGQRGDRVAVAAAALREAAGAQGRRPVGLDRDGVEVKVGDQAPRQFDAETVELVRAVGRFTHQHQLGVANSVEQDVDICEPDEFVRLAADRLGNCMRCHAELAASGVPAACRVSGGARGAAGRRPRAGRCRGPGAWAPGRAAAEVAGPDAVPVAGGCS
jgi:hypothetical protein